MDTAPWSRLKSEIYAFFGRNPRTNRMIVTLAGLQTDHVVLDVGCGPGAAVRNAAPRVQRAIGVDRAAAMVEIARRRSAGHANVEFHVAAAEELPFPDNSIDVAWTIHAFHHWEAPDAGIAEMARIIRPGGRFLIVETESRGSHGLSPARADEVAAQLQSDGFASASVAKHRKQFVVTGVGAAPTG